VKVVARDSAFRYVGTSLDPREVGRALGAARLLRGRLLQQGDRLSVGVELLDTGDGTILWSQHWERPASGLLLVAQEIDRELRLRLAVAEAPRVAASTGNPEAYRLYLRGRYFWNTRTEANLKRGAEAFQQAIDSDPGYSLAWAGLADAFLMLGAWSVLEPKDAYPRAKAAADRAIALDPSLAEPHATIGYLKTIYERDWPGADAAFRVAIDLHPNYATAHHWYAFYLQTIGDIPGSLARIERASEIDPLSPVINSERSYFFSYASQFDRALQEAQKFLAIEPSSVYARTMLAQAYAHLRRSQEAAAELATIVAGSKPGVVTLGRVAVVYAQIGEREKAHGIIRELLDVSRRRYVYPSLMAQAYAALGDRDLAFEYFDRAVADRSLVASWLRAPELEPVRSDPRFKSLLARLGLKP
jgi:tetratricopeptide (TPR) repeat protein